MSHENVEIARRLFTAFSCGDATAMLSEMDLVRTRQTGSGKSSGIPLEGLFWFVSQVREGKVVRVHILNSEQEALEAVGLRE